MWSTGRTAIEVATLSRAEWLDAGDRRCLPARHLTLVEQVFKLVLRETLGLGQCLARLSFCSTDRSFQLLPETNPRYREEVRFVVGLLNVWPVETLFVSEDVDDD